MSMFDPAGPLTIPLEERLARLERGQGPAYVTSSELRHIAERRPELLSRDWRIATAARLGHTHDYTPFMVVVVPDADVPGKHESKVLKTWEPRLRPLEKALVEAGRRTEAVRAELHRALAELAKAKAQAARGSGVTEDGQPLLPPDGPAVREARERVEDLEEQLRVAEAEEREAMVRYSKACQRFEAERMAARNRDLKASGALT